MSWCRRRAYSSSWPRTTLPARSYARRARAELRGVTERIAQVVVEVELETDGPSQLRVDGVEAVGWQVYLAPGRHQIEVYADGQRHTWQLSLVAGEQKTLSWGARRRAVPARRGRCSLGPGGTC